MNPDRDARRSRAQGSQEVNGPEPDGEDRPMWKRFMLPLLLVLALLASAVAVSLSSSRDRDHDGLPTSWEHRYGISTKKKSGKQDPDHDRLTNRREYKLHTNPRKRDTDRDGYNDGLEVRKGTNPRDRRSNPGFPTPATTGVPPGWTPKQTRTTTLRVTEPGAVVQDVLLKNADIAVEAPNVTLRRVVLQGGVINNDVSSCAPGLTIEESTIEPAPGQDSGDDTEGVISYGGYTAKSVKIWHRSEGFRASDCGPVRIENSFALVTPPQPCGDWHGDGLQGYDAGAITVRNVTLDLDMSGCDGTAPFFVPSGQGNTERRRRSPAGQGRRLSVPARGPGERSPG